MKRVRIAELKDRLSEHLRAVERGAEVIVLDRDRPIARIVPVLPRDRRVRVLGPSRPFAEIRDRRRSSAHWPVSSTELLSEERQEG
jgi:prevent-host-death family protein